MIVSFHKFEVGFYHGKGVHYLHHCVYTLLLLLGTGSIDSVGQGRGTFYCINVPLKDGISDQPFTQLFARCHCYVLTQPEEIAIFLKYHRWKIFWQRENHSLILPTN